MTAISATEADEVGKMKMELRRLVFDEQVRGQKRKAGESLIEAVAAGNLMPWREIVTPHADVASGRYLNLPRLAGPEVLVHAIRDGVALLTRQSDAITYAESHDDAAGRYAGLRGGQVINVSADSGGMLVKPNVAKTQLNAEAPSPTPGPTGGTSVGGATGGDGEDVAACGGKGSGTVQPKPQLPRRFHDTVRLDPTRVGRDSSRIADEVIAYLAGKSGAEVTVTLEIKATLPGEATDQIVRTVTENGRTLKFSSQGFETEGQDWGSCSRAPTRSPRRCTWPRYWRCTIASCRH